VPKTDPKDIAAPANDTVPPPQTKASTPGSAVFAAPRALPPVAPSANETSYIVKIGPVSEGNAAEIIRQLGAAHYPPKMEHAQTEPQRFRVVSGPLPRGAAEQLVASLAQNGFPSLTRSLPEDRVEVQFGVFSAQGYAEDLADRIQGRGYTPAVVRQAAVPIITVGPYSVASVKAILTLIESTMPDRSLMTVPCGSKDPLNHAWRGWVQVCEVSSDGPR
jgi:cell division septation protein DedD